MSILLLLKLFYSIYSQTKCYQDRLSHPLYHLLRKLMFYPIFNMLCRSASIPYDFIYAKQLTQVDSNLSMGHLIIVYLFVICTPSTGFFDLLVFKRRPLAPFLYLFFEVLAYSCINNVGTAEQSAITFL